MEPVQRFMARLTMLGLDMPWFIKTIQCTCSSWILPYHNLSEPSSLTTAHWFTPPKPPVEEWIPAIAEHVKDRSLREILGSATALDEMIQALPEALKKALGAGVWSPTSPI